MSTKKTFAEHHRAKYWHPTKNEKITPNMVSYGSAKKYWFKCPNENCLHDFIADPNHVTALKKPTWCPYCCKASKKLCDDKKCKVCYKKSFASHPKSILWHPTKNGQTEPRDIFMSSNKKYWLQCNEDSCKHIFDVTISNITCNDRACPYCAHKRLCDKDDCVPCMRRSFASHHRAKYWDKEKNGKTKPRNIFPTTSYEPFWFKCDNNHSFCDTLGHITDKNEPRWCGICLGSNRRGMTSENYLMEALEFAKEKNGELLSTEYINMYTLLDWKCNICEHQWQACLSSIKHQGSWCPKCAKCVPYTLNDCHAFAKLKEGQCLSNQYINNGTVMEWKCKDGYIWNTTYASIIAGTWCPHCANRLPKTLEDAKKVAVEKDGECLSTEYINAKTLMLWRCKNNHTWEQTYDNISRVSWCPECDQAKGEVETRELFEKITGKLFPKKRSIFTNKKMELDGFNDEMKIGFEQQGIQHYEYVPFFHRNDITNFQKQCERDQQKRDECKSLGIYLIEIPYTLLDIKKEEYIRAKLDEIGNLKIHESKEKIWNSYDEFTTTNEIIQPEEQKIAVVTTVSSDKVKRRKPKIAKPTNNN